MRSAVRAKNARIIAVDNSPEMIARLKETLASGSEDDGLLPVEAVHQDILETKIINASVVVLNFTLQFIERAARQNLLKTIATGLKPGGILILSEKICFDDPVEQELQTAWHLDFKRSQGYSELEIARKRDALENVMKPDSLSKHYDRLRQAGFERSYLWYQGFNFISLVAFR
jgi:tRNA (cmo5U34)-methyltransferase